MRVIKTILILLAIIVIAGVGIGATVFTNVSCTQMACVPIDQTGIQEAPCNGCTISKYLFFSWVINIGKVCRAQETLIFDYTGDEETHMHRLDIKEPCRYGVTFFGLR